MRHFQSFTISSGTISLEIAGTAMWMSQDTMAEKYYPLAPYLYCAGSPVLLSDLKGKSPVYGSDGTYRGNTIEGFTGAVKIYPKRDQSNIG